MRAERPFTVLEKPTLSPQEYRRPKAPSQKASQRLRAEYHLQCARRTARLTEFPDKDREQEKSAFDEFQSIEDDLADLRMHLKKAKLTLADIGSSEAELELLQVEEQRLKRPLQETKESTPHPDV